MTNLTRTLMWTLCILAALSATACNESGFGLSVPPSGARWSGPGPDVLVAGGPR